MVGVDFRTLALVWVTTSPTTTFAQTYAEVLGVGSTSPSATFAQTFAEVLLLGIPRDKRSSHGVDSMYHENSVIIGAAVVSSGVVEAGSLQVGPMSFGKMEECGDSGNGIALYARVAFWHGCNFTEAVKPLG